MLYVNQSISKERDSYKKSLERFKQVMQQKNRELTDKIQGVDNLRNKYHQALGQMERNAFTEVITKKSSKKTKKSTQQQFTNQNKDFYLNQES